MRTLGAGSLCATRFAVCNQMVYDCLKKILVIDTPGWSFIGDGRGAFPALKAQSRGPAVDATRQAAACAHMNNFSYHGCGRSTS